MQESSGSSRNQNRKWIAIGGLVIVAIVVALLAVFLGRKPAAQPAPAPAVVIPDPRETSIGKSVEGRSIESYAYGKGGKKIVFVGGVHGGYEWNSVLLAYQFMDYLKANPDAIPPSLTVTVIPDLNPDAVFKATGKEGRFALSDVSTDPKLLASARFNADNVDLNRNFACDWQATSTWQTKIVSAGTAAFSEPEAAAFKKFVAAYQPDAAVFWHSAAGAVYASQCGKGILPGTLDIMNTYAKAAGYPAVKVFGAYATTGAADDWLASQGIPAITVELSSHSSVEWDKNILGIKAVLESYAQ